ncbi:MAG: GDYXXLXY domain-containing protein [Acidimicrobiales bacterium]
MSRRHLLAVAVALATMIAALGQPLWIRTTGADVALALQPVDPLSLFRGNYVDLTYDVRADVPSRLDRGDPAYVVFDDARPATALRVESSRPTLGPGETCIRGEFVFGDRISFPALEQYFVTPEEGSRLERELSGMVGIVRTTGSCRAILVRIEPR